MDIVPNHTSDKHIWFQKALQGDEKYKNYYVWAKGKDNKTPPNNWISVFNDSAWTYVDSLKQWYLHQFEYRQPDLNYRNPAVRNEMRVSYREKFSCFKMLSCVYCISRRRLSLKYPFQSH